MCNKPELKEKVKSLKHLIQKQIRQAFWKYIDGLISLDNYDGLLDHLNKKDFISRSKAYGRATPG